MDNQNNKKNDNNNRQNYGIIIITTIIAAVFVMFLYQLMQDTPSQEIRIRNSWIWWRRGK